MELVKLSDPLTVGAVFQIKGGDARVLLIRSDNNMVRCVRARDKKPLKYKCRFLKKTFDYIGHIPKKGVPSHIDRKKEKTRWFTLRGMPDCMVKLISVDGNSDQVVYQHMSGTRKKTSLKDFMERYEEKK